MTELCCNYCALELRTSAQGWPEKARRNVHCHLFSRKWPKDTADHLLDAALQMRIVTALVDSPRGDNTSLVQCF